MTHNTTIDVSKQSTHLLVSILTQFKPDVAYTENEMALFLAIVKELQKRWANE